MKKDNLNEALFELKDRERGKKPKPSAKKPRVKRGRPKAFDSFYVFSTFLLAMGLALQVLAIVLYS
ncbi:hypothetical protein [Pelagicoccus sp. SDUM812003]|uniref:hypothetical protein n=1 Tax=Pelagicoccus sp. SDUM812003 TaxID=3041267 RepID=UPI00280D0384|nr:hypothetical protein [Pelagicoccus sp. SDUM812003]MDQ8204236.1 hypothetical protein [Pelagicoccus sp. SDUM812003]